MPIPGMGVYSAEERKYVSEQSVHGCSNLSMKRIQKFIEKRPLRVWTKKIKYDVRKNFADSRVRIKGRFVKKEEEGKLSNFCASYSNALIIFRLPKGVLGERGEADHTVIFCYPIRIIAELQHLFYNFFINSTFLCHVSFVYLG